MNERSFRRTQVLRNAWQIYITRKTLAIAILGFAAGLPLPLIYQTMTAWLTDAGVSRATIGFFAWIGIAYAIKVVWSPLIDQLKIPVFHSLLGQRRSWLLLAQISIAIGLYVITQLDPKTQLPMFAGIAVWIAFWSASQDIALDAYRIEIAPPEQQAALAASYVFGYRVGMLMAGAGALLLADRFSWSVAYLVMSVCMGIGMLATLGTRTTHHANNQSRLLAPTHLSQSLVDWWLRAIIHPFLNFFQRYGKISLVILALIATFRLSDISMGIMANPFYLELGFSKTQIAEISKVFGLVMILIGGAIGGVTVMRFGYLRPMLAAAVLVATTNLLFVMLARVGPNPLALVFTITADNISGGFAMAIFIGYLSSLTHRDYTATQYALFSSLMNLLAQIIAGWSGLIVEKIGYEWFFVYTTALGIPALVIVSVLIQLERRRREIKTF